MTGLKTETVIEWLKIVSNIFLGVILLITIFMIINYRQEVNEVIGGNDPERLMQKYEEETNTKCLCTDPNYGQVIYVSSLPE